MPVEFIVNDNTNGRLYVKRLDDKIEFYTTGGSRCWASIDDVRKLISELDEIVADIEGEVG